jgi:adenylate cyclase
MIDADSGAHLWADRFNGDLSKLADFRDAVTTHVWRYLNFNLPGWETRRSLHQWPDHPGVLDYVLRALALLHRNVAPSKQEYADIRSLLRAAVQIDPQDINAQTFLARVDIAEASDFLSDSRADQLRHAELAIDRVLAVAPFHYLVHRTKADLLRSSQRPVEAIGEYEVTLKLNPNDVTAYAWIGSSKWLSGCPEESFEYFDEALRRSPKDRDLPIWRTWLGHIHFATGNLDAAINAYRTAAAGLPIGVARLYLACAFGMSGRTKDALPAFADANRLLPGFTIAKWKANINSTDPNYLAWRERCYDVARGFGMPEE